MICLKPAKSLALLSILSLFIINTGCEDKFAFDAVELPTEEELVAETPAQPVDPPVIPEPAPEEPPVVVGDAKSFQANIVAGQSIGEMDIVFVIDNSGSMAGDP